MPSVKAQGLPLSGPGSQKPGKAPYRDSDEARAAGEGAMASVGFSAPPQAHPQPRLSVRQA